MILCVNYDDDDDDDDDDDNDDDDNDDDDDGVVKALVEVLINSSSECFQGWTVDQVGGGGG